LHSHEPPITTCSSFCFDLRDDSSLSHSTSGWLTWRSRLPKPDQSVNQGFCLIPCSQSVESYAILLQGSPPCCAHCRSDLFWASKNLSHLIPQAIRYLQSSSNCHRYFLIGIADVGFTLLAGFLCMFSFHMPILGLWGFIILLRRSMETTTFLPLVVLLDLCAPEFSYVGSRPYQ
jgi:hypothetical protein